MRSPLDRFERGPKKAPFVNDQHVFRPVSPARRLRGKLILVGFMGLATIATGLFIHAKLSRQSTTLVTAEELPRAEPAAPTEGRAAVEPDATRVEATRSMTIAVADPAGDIDPDTLGHQDPRWVREAITALPTAKPNPVLEQAETERPQVEEAVAYAEPDTQPVRDDEAESDRQFTAAIPPGAIDPKPEMQNPEASDESAASGGQATKVVRAVNLRSNARSGSRVIKVIPAGATVGLVSCKSWCEVTYQGSRGFIYKSFLGKGYSSRSSARFKPRQSTAKATGQANAPAERKLLTQR